jgi:hypothetical protein
MYFPSDEVLKAINFYELMDGGTSNVLLLGGFMALNVLYTAIFYLSVFKAKS